MNALSLAARALACAGAPALCLAALPFAHGGTYRGPGDTVPPGGGSTGGVGTGPHTPGSGPGTPAGPTGPTTGPTTGPGGPSGPAASAPPTGGSSEDLTDWSYWWEFNKEPYLLLKDAILSAAPTTGSAEWFLSKSGRAEGPDIELMLTDEQRRTIEEALLAALAKESHQDIVTGAMMALAKMGEVKDESGRSRFEEAFLPQLKSASGEVVETAALALGILAHPSSVPALAHLLRDDASGRQLVGEHEVPFRVRAFAAYGLALLGRRASDEAVKRTIAEHLVATLESDAAATRDVQVACMIALGLVPLQPLEPPGEGTPEPAASRPAAAASRIGEIEFLQAYLRDEKRPEIVRAHAPVALARLIEGLPPELHARYRDGIAEDLLRLLGTRSRAGAFVRQSAVLALGQLGDADQDALDARIRDQLMESAKDGADAQERCFALIALAQAGGRTGQGAAPPEDDVTRHLVATLRGSAPLRPWAGIAVGVRGAALRGAGGVPPKDATAALLTRLSEERSAGPLGAYAIGAGLLGDAGAKFVLRERLLSESEDLAVGYIAVGLGLLQDREAAELIQRVLHESKYRPELLKQAAIALGLLGDKDTVTALIEMLRGSDTLSAQAALASALGTIGDARSVDALLALLRSDSASETARGFAAAALGIVADRERLPWNTALSVDLNYRASTETLNDQVGKGVLNIL